MKRVFLIILFIIVTVNNVVYGQKSDRSFLSWNKAVGIGVGYTNMFQKFTSDYEGVSAPQNLVHFDLMIYGVYAGIDAMVKDTGYDVYGYSEKLSTWAFKIGPSFRLGKSDRWRFILTPYVGATFYTLFDGSNNSIGARDEYGVKEIKFLGGYRIAAAYDWYYFSLHFSTREYGVSFGVEFEL